MEESGFEKPAEPARGSGADRVISRDVYPQLEGESDSDYDARIYNMSAEAHRDIEGDAVTDAKKAENIAWADFRQDRGTFEDYEKAKADVDLKREQEAARRAGQDAANATAEERAKMFKNGDF